MVYSYGNFIILFVFVKLTVARATADAGAEK